MKDILIKARRAVRFLFYRDVSIENQILVSDTLDDTELEILFGNLIKLIDTIQLRFYIEQ